MMEPITLLEWAYDLEKVGDNRAIGMRWLASHSKYPIVTECAGCYWVPDTCVGLKASARLPAPVGEGNWEGPHWSVIDAFLAAAEIMTNIISTLH